MGSLHPGYDFDQQIQETQRRPWQEQNADMSEYFNYGFNEQAFLMFISQQINNMAR